MTGPVLIEVPNICEVGRMLDIVAKTSKKLATCNPGSELCVERLTCSVENVSTDNGNPSIKILKKDGFAVLISQLLGNMKINSKLLGDGYRTLAASRELQWEFA